MRVTRFLSFLRSRPRLLASAGLTAVTLLGAGAGLTLGVWRNVCHDCPSIAQLYVWEPKQATRIFGRDGRLVAELAEERRTPVALEDLPEYVPHAYIAIEDKRFRRHPGFDVRGIARSAFNLVLKGRIAGGGSTITQQLARNMFEQRIGFEKRFQRKLKELRVALQLEEVYDKDQILEAYINQVNYGRGHYGIESASRWFFGKPAARVDPAEAALLAAVINLPEAYSPFRHPERARARRNLVLELMAEQGYLSRPDAERWKEAPIPERPRDGAEGQIAPYFVEWVRDMLDERYGSNLYSKGFRIHTTLDVEFQRRALEAMENGWRRIEAQPGYEHPTYAEVAQRGEPIPDNATPYLQGMFIAMDPATGEVKALIGGRDFGESKFNRATQARRQPGSVFKPFVYTAAIAGEIPASHVIDDAPIMVEQQDGSTWAPRNYTGEFHGQMTLREALRRSVNIVAIKLGREVGLETVAQSAQRLGIRTPIPRYESMAIGSADVIPIQVMEAYSTFAMGGVRVQPRAVERVEDAEGRVLWESRPERERVLDPLAAYVVRDMMRDVVDAGTAYNALRNELVSQHVIPYEVPIAGKTGTTNDYTDVWFVGYTPNLMAAVWFGFDRPRTILPQATGGGYAAPVWAEFAHDIYYGSEPPLRELPPEDAWPIPPELVHRPIDGESGKLATEWCPTDQVYAEIFLPGTEPTEVCDLHGPGIFGAPLRGIRPDTGVADSLRPDSARRDTIGADAARPDSARRDTMRAAPVRPGAGAG